MKFIRRLQEEKLKRLDDEYFRLRELVDGIDFSEWPEDYELARIDCARVARQRANLAAKLRLEV